MCLSFMDSMFDDKRKTCVCLSCWMCIVMVILYEIGILKSKFMTLGPSDSTVFMGIAINTWYRYNLVMTFTFVNTCINDFMSDAISPWIINTITDHKNMYIPYSKVTCICISQIWSMYCNCMGVLNMFLAFTQIDFIIVRTVADLSMSMYTNIKFLKHKIHDPEKYTQNQHQHTNPEGIEMDHLIGKS